MTRRILLSPAAIVLMVLSGCNPLVEAPVIQQPTVAVFDATPAKVWNAIVATLGIEFPIQVIERDSGLISTRPITMLLPANRWAYGCDNTNDFANPWNQLRMDMRLLAEGREGGKTQVTLVCHFEAFKESTWPKAWTIVASNGALENELLKKIQRRLQTQFAQ
jgi:hypothetical protein